MSCTYLNQLIRSLPVSCNVCDVSLSISFSKTWVSLSISDAGGLGFNELWTLSHSNELAEDMRDHDSLLHAGAVFRVLDSLQLSSPNAVHELPDVSGTIDGWTISCSHSKSSELAGVETVVFAKSALASNDCKGMSLLWQELVLGSCWDSLSLL